MPIAIDLAVAGPRTRIALAPRRTDRLAVRGGQRLHDIVYVTAALALVHYLLSPGIFPDQYLTSGLFFWLMAWRLVARRRLGTDVRALVGLAVVSCLFTALLEALWVWAYH